MMSDILEKPLPRIDSVTHPFWEATASDRLVMQRCAACGSFVWTPRPACNECGSDSLVWTTLGGRGTIFSYTIIRRVRGLGSRAFEPEIPYAVIWVDLEEGPRMISNLVGDTHDRVAIGQQVRVVFEAAPGGIKLPKFALAR